MRVVVTGGAGFIGRALVNKLARGGVEVVALVRDPAKASYLQGPRVTLVSSDLSDVQAMTEQMRGADGVIHAAGSYRVGITKAERPHMFDANVGTTERVLDAAGAANVRRIVYVSTANIFGDTHGVVADETYQRDPKTREGRYVSYYDETKHLAHLAAERRIAQGAPVVIVLPAQVYGPNDHAAVSSQIEAAFHGTLPYIVFPETGIAWVHVDDLVDGIVAALIRGRIGESYILAGAPLRLGESLQIAARAGGHRLPRLTMPTAALRVLAALGRFGVRLPNAPANLGETIEAAQATYWGSAAKAIKELGFRARPLEQGVKDTWGSAAKGA